jgi:hypothetical protein
MGVGSEGTVMLTQPFSVSAAAKATITAGGARMRVSQLKTKR